MAQWISFHSDVWSCDQKNMAAMGGAYFHYMTYSETLKNLLLHNGSMDFIVIWYECALGGPL